MSAHSKTAGDKIKAGLFDAREYARVQRAVLDWIKHDAPVATQMQLQPVHWNKLIDRICGSTTHTPEVKS
jgi:hypothetical protein